MKKILFLLVLMCGLLVKQDVEASAETELQVKMQNAEDWEGEEIIALEEKSNNISDSSVTIDIDELLKKSDGIMLCGSTQSGIYYSDWKSAGMLGYKYRISFEWEATINENGDYKFGSVSNAKVSTKINYLVLALSWNHYSYTLTEKKYSFNSDRTTILVDIDYQFIMLDKNNMEQEFWVENHDEVKMDDIIG